MGETTYQLVQDFFHQQYHKDIGILSEPTRKDVEWHIFEDFLGRELLILIIAGWTCNMLSCHIETWYRILYIWYVCIIYTYVYIHILLLPGCKRWSIWLVWWKIPIQPDRQKVLKGKPTSLANSEEYVSTKGTNFFHLHSFCFQSVRGCNDFLPQA